MTAARVMRGAISLSNSSHFPLMPYSNHETGGVAARPRQAIDEAGADRIGDRANTIGTVRVACCSGPDRAVGHDDVRRERDQLRHVVGECVVSPPAQRVSIRTLRPMVQPNSASPAEMPRGGLAIPDRPRQSSSSTPMRRIRSGCCARAASGHAPPRRRAA